MARANGTPDWQLDKMREDESEKIWESQQPESNEPKPSPLMKKTFREVNNSHACLAVVKLDFESVKTYLDKAMETIKGTPEADKLASIYDAVADLNGETMEVMKTLKEAMASGRLNWK